MLTGKFDCNINFEGTIHPLKWQSQAYQRNGDTKTL